MNLERLIDRIVREDGWCEESSRDKYLASAEKLEALGLSEDNIFNLLNTLYWTDVNEYGVSYE